LSAEPERTLVPPWVKHTEWTYSAKTHFSFGGLVPSNDVILVRFFFFSRHRFSKTSHFFFFFPPMTEHMHAPSLVAELAAYRARRAFNPADWVEKKVSTITFFFFFFFSFF
jgi:hypothetical protein